MVSLSFPSFRRPSSRSSSSTSSRIVNSRQQDSRSYSQLQSQSQSQQHQQQYSQSYYPYQTHHLKQPPLSYSSEPNSPITPHNHNPPLPFPSVSARPSSRTTTSSSVDPIDHPPYAYEIYNDFTPNSSLTLTPSAAAPKLEPSPVFTPSIANTQQPVKRRPRLSSVLGRRKDSLEKVEDRIQQQPVDSQDKENIVYCVDTGKPIRRPSQSPPFKRHRRQRSSREILQSLLTRAPTRRNRSNTLDSPLQEINPNIHNGTSYSSTPASFLDRPNTPATPTVSASGAPRGKRRLSMLVDAPSPIKEASSPAAAPTPQPNNTFSPSQVLNISGMSFLPKPSRSSASPEENTLSPSPAPKRSRRHTLRQTKNMLKGWASRKQTTDETAVDKTSPALEKPLPSLPPDVSARPEIFSSASGVNSTYSAPASDFDVPSEFDNSRMSLSSRHSEPQTPHFPPGNTISAVPPPPSVKTKPRSQSQSIQRPQAPSPLKLNRIMATLSDDDLEKLFSGAPQFFARSEGHHTGAPHPSVAFPWNEELEIRDMTDYTRIGDPAWSAVSAWPHITLDSRFEHSGAAPVKSGPKNQSRPHFYPRCRERPNMLSTQGLEKGSMGYQAALEFSVSDALQEEQYGFNTLGKKKPVIREQRERIRDSKNGLRSLSEQVILDQLIKNATRYHSGELSTNSASELYNELFLHLLHPPARVTDHHNPYSLSVQIQVLLTVLATPNVWIDFSHVEWRIRLGQILWGRTQDEDEISDKADIHDVDSNKEKGEERYWLLVQVLLSCELLIRLDAITAGEELGMESIPYSQVRKFEREATSSVKWSLHLARSWLENIEVLKETQPSADNLSAPEAKASQPLPSSEGHGFGGWVSSFISRLVVPNHSTSVKEPFHVYLLRGRHQKRQVDGLYHFAKKLCWPGLEDGVAQISDSCNDAGAASAVSSVMPLPPSHQHDGRSFLSSLLYSPSVTAPKKETVDTSKPGIVTRRRKVTAMLHQNGWLSKSYISGFFLPGEGLSYFLMASLLENDKTALEKLGQVATLSGGFVFQNRSFWNTASVLGRVLAASREATECMGWVSTTILPSTNSDGWHDVVVEDIHEDLVNTGKRARLWGKTFIEKESSVTGSMGPSLVYPADFIVPQENNYLNSPASVRIRLSSLGLTPLQVNDQADLFHTKSSQTPLTEETSSSTTEAGTQLAPSSSASSSPPFPGLDLEKSIVSSTATISFQIQDLDQPSAVEQIVRIPVCKDVYFVTAHPCVPSNRVRYIKSPSSPTIQHVSMEVGGPTMSPVHPTSPNTARQLGHPLHKSYTYTVVHISDLIRRRTESLDSLLRNTPMAHTPSFTPTGDTQPRVLVIDCVTNMAEVSDLPSNPPSPVLRRGKTFGMELQVDSHPMYYGHRFGSDLEVLVRSICAEKGWNAVISRKRRGCLACAIREAGALSWKVIVRVY